jgi:hypothetical protein
MKKDLFISHSQPQSLLFGGKLSCRSICCHTVVAHIHGIWLECTVTLIDPYISIWYLELSVIERRSKRSYILN